jgi:hypothetical protein
MSNAVRKKRIEVEVEEKSQENTIVSNQLSIEYQNKID